MRRKMILILLISLFLINCSGLKKGSVDELNNRRLEISFSFNSEHYQWLMGKKYPQIAIWIESESADPQTLFVTQGAAKNDWYFANERPESLPVWFGVRKKEAHLNVDAVTGATPGGDSHVINLEIPKTYRNKKINVFLEANVSFDYNEFYKKEEASPGFSGVNGQPSIIWEASFNTDGSPETVKPQIIGHGHVLGENNQIDPDLSNISTANKLFDHVAISYHPGR